MAATDFVTETQLDSLTTNVATAIKANTTLTNTKTDDTTVDAHVADTTAAHAASAISIADGGALYTATTVEAALAEVRNVADAAAGGGIAIDDGSPASTTSTYSASKIESTATAAASAAVDVVIGAASGAADTLKELEDADTSILSALGSRLRFDAAQALTAPNKAQALTNLGIVASAVDFAALFTAALV